MYKNYFKRVIDFIISILCLPFLFLIFLIVKPIIKFTDNGPIFYISERIGRNGKLFKMYKFRSMKVNAPDIRLEDGCTFNGVNDPRVTKIGKFLRETSLDEVPQILNVLKGEMSLIGPRPDLPDWIDKYPKENRVLLTVRPGVTGYSQAYFRNSITSKEKMNNDAYYALNCSPLFDIKIFFKTISVVLKKENMYRSDPSHSEMNQDVDH